ncbi:putative sulfate exporter family transporter [Sorangium sp. So ce1036]|uniref:YeiH family protein n=1 Tax=Sorangium sp. So ce1036 TaxID=3133328 RepID=UPI003F046CC3
MTTPAAPVPDTPSTPDSGPPAAAPLPFWRNEDWIAVVLGALTLLPLLAGLRPALPTLKWGSAAELTSTVLSAANLWSSLQVGLALLAVSAVGVVLLGRDLARYALGFPVVYGLSWLAQVLAGNAVVHHYGVEYVIFALLLGLFISNVIGLPGWLREAVQTEYYIKTGLVLLGAGILFQEILKAGAFGILQSLLVVLVVWYACFWLARRLRVDDEFAVMLSTAVSICGVSAAIAACGAIQGDRRKLSYVSSLVLLVALPMIFLQPWIVKALGIPDLVGGAWLGGTLDTTGSVVAAGALISERALKAGTIVKFSQNVLLGVAAFILSLWWTLRNASAGAPRPTARLIWERFPKFVLGFLATSLLFSFLVDPAVVTETKGTIGGLRTTWFALAFTSIGLETHFGSVLKMDGGRPALAFIGAQLINLVWTLLIAFLLFGGLLFPPPAIR